MKKVLVILIAITIIMLLSGCGSTSVNTEQSHPETSVESSLSSPSTEIPENNTVDNPVPQGNTIVAPENPALVITDGFLKDQTGKYSKICFTVKNNTELTIPKLYLHIVLLDNNGTIVDNFSMASSVRVAPGQSIILDGTVKDISGFKAIVDSYSYYPGDPSTTQNIEQYVDDSPEVYIP